MNKINPLVTIVVPVYNGENYLRDCLDSLVNQSYKNIEILIINNCSTDNSLNIISEYIEKYPNIINIINIPDDKFEQYAGGTRYHGYKNAKGSYITSCDCDDYMHYRAIEWYIEALNDYGKDCDVIVSPTYEIINGINNSNNMRLMYKLNHCDVKNVIFNSNPSLWSKLINKDFYNSHKPISRDLVLEDFGYHFTVIPYAKKIVYCKNATYYYIRRANSESISFSNPEKVKKLYQAVDYVMNNLPDINTKYSVTAVARWLLSSINGRWIYSSESIARIKKYYKYFILCNDELVKLKKGYDRLLYLYYSLPCDLPPYIYIDGFGMKNCTQRIEYIKNNAFYDGCEVIVLNENNCNIKNVKYVYEAYECKDFDFVAKYFALKMIYEKGGIFLHDSIVIENPMDFLKNYSIFFCYMTNTEFTDCIFGASSGNIVISELIETYENNFFNERFTKLKKRIKYILTMHHKVQINGKTSIFLYDVTIFAPEVTVYANYNSKLTTLNSPIHICSHDFNKLDCSDLDIISINRELINNIIKPVSQNNKDITDAKRFRHYYNFYLKLNKISKFLILFILNRELCKIKIKKKLGENSLLFKCLRIIYRIISKIKKGVKK